MRTRMQRPHLNDLQTAPPWFIHSYTYNDANQLTTMVQNGTTTTYAYNAAGELTTITRNGQSIALTWTGMGRMNGFGTNAYSYNALGQLVSVNSLRAKSIFGDSAASQVWRDGNTEQLWGLGLAGRFSPTQGEFTLQGVPGSIEMTTGTNGVINGSLEMDAYGDLETATGNLQWGQTPYRYIGGLNCQSEGLAYFGGGTGEGNSYRLIMMGERWYDPQVGRFISRDPVFSENLYAYCANDPVNAVDPEGRWSWGIDLNVTAMCGLGFTFGVAVMMGTDANGDTVASIIPYGGWIVGGGLGGNVGGGIVEGDPRSTIGSGTSHSTVGGVFLPWGSGSFADDGTYGNGSAVMSPARLGVGWGGGAYGGEIWSRPLFTWNLSQTVVKPVVDAAGVFAWKLDQAILLECGVNDPRLGR